MIIGITGGSGAGKSTVSKLFEERGVYVTDADIAAREIVKKGQPALQEIAETFGEGVINDDGTLARRALGDIVFSSPQSLKKLNEIMHPRIAEYIKSRINEHKGELALIDGAALIESGIDRMCDYMCVVIADKQTRIERICARDGLSHEQAQARIEAQQPDEFYTSRADFIICNNGGDDELEAQVESILNEIELRKSE